MNPYTKKIVKTLVGAVVFIVCIALVVIGKRTISYGALGLMLLGLIGLLVLLFLYNRAYVKPPKD